jgi:hypothetical protein
LVWRLNSAIVAEFSETMMPWTINDPVKLYHGTDLSSAQALQGGHSPIQLAMCRPLTDFGRGFYTTTNLHQAKNWANVRAQRLFHQGRRQPAAVLEFHLQWKALDTLTRVSFVVEGALTGDYWQLVTTCRRGQIGDPPPYDLVFGPVTLWPQTLIVKDCDQISFHSPRAVNALGVPTIGHDAGRANILFAIT